MLFCHHNQLSWEILKRGGDSAYVNAPEFLNGVEGDNFFQEIIPIVILNRSQYCNQGDGDVGAYLSTWWLGEPESPFVH